jgi:hypothetical protein
MHLGRRDSPRDLGEEAIFVALGSDICVAEFQRSPEKLS